MKKANCEMKVADNEYSGTKKDAVAERNVSRMVKECIRNRKDKGFIDRNKKTQDMLRKLKNAVY